MNHTSGVIDSLTHQIFKCFGRFRPKTLAAQEPYISAGRNFIELHLMFVRRLVQGEIEILQYIARIAVPYAENKESLAVAAPDTVFAQIHFPRFIFQFAERFDTFHQQFAVAVVNCGVDLQPSERKSGVCKLKINFAGGRKIFA